MTRDGLILDRYEPLGTAGEGGFGTVEIAWDPRIQRKVAIKTIKLTALDAARAALPGAQAVSNPSTADRWHGAVRWSEYLAESSDEDPTAGPASPSWTHPPDEEEAPRANDQVTSLAHLPGLDEARTAAMLSDPSIVTVYDFEVRDRMAYLIMEYVEGITLTRLLADYPDYLTLDMVAAVFNAVAGALDTAHDAGVLHLDIKPDNILINLQGQVKVTDFGLATLADASGTGTTGGGTIGYMPLEQIRREHLDARTDEWSLAAITYEMLTGSNPFRVRSLDEAEAAIENAELVLPSLCWENLDAQADDVVFYALDPDREERYQSVSDFAEELDKFLGDPVQGTEQLALVVEDALGVYDDADEPQDDVQQEEADTPIERRMRPRALDRVLSLLPVRSPRTSKPVAAGRNEEPHGADYREDDYPDEDIEPTEQRARTADRKRLPEHRAHEPLGTRLNERTVALGARAFAALASGFTAWFSLTNMQILSAGFGPGTQYVIAAGAVLVGVLGAFWAHIGALIAFSLLGIALILCGHPIVGAIVLVATVVWWYTVGHEGKAAANIALLTPTLGAIGGSSAVPLLAGAALKPVQAAVTTAFAVVCAIALGSLGSGSLLGWDAPTFWNFSRMVTGDHVVAMVTAPATWATAAGWLVSSITLSLLRERGNRWLAIAGIALALAALLIGSLVFAAPTPQLIVSTSLTAAVLLIVFLQA